MAPLKVKTCKFSEGCWYETKLVVTDEDGEKCWRVLGAGSTKEGAVADACRSVVEEENYFCSSFLVKSKAGDFFHLVYNRGWTYYIIHDAASARGFPGSVVLPRGTTVEEAKARMLRHVGQNDWENGQVCEICGGEIESHVDATKVDRLKGNAHCSCVDNQRSRFHV